MRPGGGSRSPIDCRLTPGSDWFVKMDGRPVFKWAVRLLEDSSREVSASAGFSTADVKLWLFHQANIRILDAAVDALGIDSQQDVKHTSTVTATPPPAACRSHSTKRSAPADFDRNDLLMMSGFGGGLAWGTTLLRW